MAKRVAAKQLTMDNYDQEDDEEYPEADAGPQLASPEVLKNRPIAKAKRRSELNASDDMPKAFGGFSGFKGFNSNPLQNSITSSMPLKSLSQKEAKDNCFRTSTPVMPNETNGSKTANQTTKPAAEGQTEDDSDVYDKKLSELNKSFYNHIKSYMSRSEFYDFTLVCKEYIDYHQKIESEANSQTNSATKSVSSQDTASVKTSQTSDYDSAKSSQLTSSSHISEQKPTPFSSQSLFPSQASSVTDSTFFAKPSVQFSFKPTATESSAKVEANTEGANEEENEEPPKVESVEHKEADSVFTKKCKLFYKKGDEWCNKGVGFLFIKKESDTSTSQLLIRSDNTLGTILLHISLNDSIPISRAPQNKGVLLSCVPNPPLDPKAKSQESVTFLIRVKAEDTEELFDNLVKYKSN